MARRLPMDSNDIQWMEENYSLQDFVEYFAENLPLVVKVTQGYEGIDSTHTIPNDQLYRLHTVANQTRVLVLDRTENRYVSIPADYQCKVHVGEESNCLSSRPVLLCDVLESLRQHVFSINPSKTKFSKVGIIFANNPSLDFFIGGEQVKRTSFGFLNLVDIYEQPYLIGHSVFEGSLYKLLVTIPVYLPIELQRASQLREEVGGFEAWLKHIARFAAEERQMTPQSPAVNEELMILSKDACEPGLDSGYEYIMPFQNVHFGDKN